MLKFLSLLLLLLIHADGKSTSDSSKDLINSNLDSSSIDEGRKSIYHPAQESTARQKDNNAGAIETIRGETSSDL
ncbi:unnamed protein product [Blepharisma stoltei]|uniref:Uncharacterized protein n=1 Tax=Blepharisma stoltei TaxID=1481888 RepID=A0AAU9J2V6_9CILI|nr:unnamed protein product [Blepharisma stoltei]